MPQMDPCAVVCVRARVLGLLEMLAAPCSRWGPAGDLALRDVGFGCAGGLWTTLSSTVETGVQAGARSPHVACMRGNANNETRPREA